MPKGHITIEPRTRLYWKGQLQKFRDACTAPHIELMSHEDRLFFISKSTWRNGKSTQRLIVRNDASAARLLIEQALLTLEMHGFKSDEISCLQGWLNAGAPSGAPGTKPVSPANRLVAHNLYERMTGYDRRHERLHRVNTLAKWKIHDGRHPLTPAELENAINPLTDEARQALENDKMHRLNQLEAKMLLRDLLGISQNTLGKILGTAKKKK